jgi:uncharacterized damage-inducible protein DinB
MERTNPEPWLRGTIEGVHPVIAQVLYSFQQAAEDLEHFTDGLTDEQVWVRSEGLTPVGAHIRHIIGSIDRLLTYTRGEQLTAGQMDSLKSEMQAGATRGELLSDLRSRIKDFESEIRRVKPETFTDARKVGRKELPTTVAGLLVHIAEHTQRHVGQAIIMAKLARRATSTE